jgi:hypothetical protein
VARFIDERSKNEVRDFIGPSQRAPEIALQAAATVQDHLEGSTTARDASQALRKTS